MANLDVYMVWRQSELNLRGRMAGKVVAAASQAEAVKLSGITDLMDVGVMKLSITDGEPRVLEMALGTEGEA